MFLKTGGPINSIIDHTSFQFSKSIFDLIFFYKRALTGKEKKMGEFQKKVPGYDASDPLCDWSVEDSPHGEDSLVTLIKLTKL